MIGQYVPRSLEAHMYQHKHPDSPALKNGPEITLRCIRSQLHWTTNLSKGTYDPRTSSPFHKPRANVYKEFKSLRILFGLPDLDHWRIVHTRYDIRTSIVSLCWMRRPRFVIGFDYPLHTVSKVTIGNPSQRTPNEELPHLHPCQTSLRESRSNLDTILTAKALEMEKEQSQR